MAPKAPRVKERLLQEVADVLGSNALESVDPPSIPKQPSESKNNLPDIPLCITQKTIPPILKNGPLDIMVGMEEEIPRWEPGSVVKWSTWRMGWPHPEDADHAAGQLALAAKKWNEAGVGVTFEYVKKSRDANFVLTYGGSNGRVLARAYFPNGNDLNIVYVYALALTPDWRDNVWKVLTHELGHVIGLRHEFAMDPMPPPPAQFEGNAVQIGPRNDLSVMNYGSDPPEIQQSDIDSTRSFYQMPVGTVIGHTAIVDYTPR